MNPLRLLFWGSVLGSAVFAAERFARLRDEADLARIRKLVAELGKPPASASPGQPSPAAPPAPGAKGPVLRQITEAVLAPKKGAFYSVAVGVSFPLSLFASTQKAKAQAESMGFTNVTASSSKPQGWPGLVNGSYYVTGTYQGPPQALERSYGGGQAHVLDVWEFG